MKTCCETVIDVADGDKKALHSTLDMKLVGLASSVKTKYNHNLGVT